MINCHQSTGHMHTNVISANKLVDVVHHNDNISNSASADFHGNTKFRNLQHDFVARRSIGIYILKLSQGRFVDGAHIQKQLPTFISEDI